MFYFVEEGRGCYLLIEYLRHLAPEWNGKMGQELDFKFSVVEFKPVNFDPTKEKVP